MSFRWGSQKLLQGLVSHELTAYLSIFNLFKLNELWPYYQKYVNHIILNYVTLQSLDLQIFEAFAWNWWLCIFHWIKLSWHSCSMWNKPGWLDWFWQFSVRGFFPVIQKDSSTHMHGLAVYVKKGLPFPQNLSLENSADSYLCFQLTLLHSVFYFFFLYWLPSSSLCMVLILLHLT